MPAMSGERPSFLLVDGNNIIHAWPDLLRLHHKRGGLAHAELIRRLGELRDFSGHRIVLVFDGTGTTASEERSSGGLQVIYSSRSRTADDVIERLALKYARTYRIIVATDDRAEQDVVVAAGGEAMSSLALRQLLESGRRDLDDWLRRHRQRDRN